ncbi:Tc toxin subunit A [Proteus vulgaris]|uniref:Tc toxin subunit A-related protein n=1 Tax=Proteus vulgaris TaxID=585 RepID=UPI001FFF1E60|nr:neuraminidase-like domain-containing protein [Proteus vulgaris]UPK80717.1 Tc toxin subunit A [Proteus vulgaris]
MKNINTLLTKMKSSTSEIITLKELAPLSLHEIRALSDEKLTWDEAKILYTQAQEAEKINKLNEAHYLARNNPQVQNAVALGIQPQSAQSRALGDWIPERGNIFVDDKSVASMFSPAGYLTELYREAKVLHAESSVYHLDKRRPDLAQLVLSQENMDKEVSTLTLSNQILTRALQNKLGGGKDLFRELATNRLTGGTPYHQPYETIRQAILLQDKNLEGLMSAVDVTRTLDSALLASIQADISPELYNILVEDVDKDTDTLFKKNFGSTNSDILNSTHFLAKYYNIEQKDAQFVIKAFNKKGKLSNKEFLNLNKIIRLYKATDMPLSSLITAIQSKNMQLNIDKEVLSNIFHLQVMMNTYPITVEQAIVLNGGLISKTSLGNTLSQFDQLFNHPPLNGNTFTDDGYHFPLDNANEATSIIRLNTLKRAFDVNDVELVMLWRLAISYNSEFDCSLKSLSLLYRTSLLAQIYGLSVNELVLLINILPKPFNGTIQSHDSSDDMGNLIHTLNDVINFAKKEKWTISELFLICSSKFESEFSSELEVLINNLKEILKNTPTDYAEQFSAISSFIAAEMGIDSIEKSNSILQWVDLEAGNKYLNEILPIIIKDTLTQQDKVDIALFFNRLKKTTLVSNKVGLNKYELEFISVKQEYLYPKEKHVLTIDKIKHITYFHHFISQCGNMANEFLTGLKNQSLTTEKMTSILNIDETTLNQALVLTPTKELKDFQNITILIQYLELSKTLGISPKDFKLLIDLKYTENNDVAGNYDKWDRLSQIMQANLNSEKTAQLTQIKDVKEAAVLTHYYASQSRNPSLISRDDVYHHLLIDNQVSAEIMTTPIAQAIANIQFYINNCLSGDEKDVDKNVKGRTFFAQWDEFNKRYSTWAGVSKLVYYPENYVDPTMRIGQTKMMDTLLQSISQNSVNRDTVEDAFKTYLTSFEQIANLEVISGYHDSVTLDDGITYFIGRNPADQMSYYWRSADHSKIKDGKMAANAWTEWTKIENGLNPYNGLIRPVIFNSRLYIAWVERLEKAKNETAEKIEKEIKYSLKLSHIRYDGSWSSPITYEIWDSLDKLNKLNFYLSYSDEFDKVMIVFYKMSETYSAEKDEFKIYYIDNELNFAKGTSSEIESVYINAKNEFDILDDSKGIRVKVINNHFIKRDKTNYTISREPNSNITVKESELASLQGSLINDAKIELNNNRITCLFSAAIKCEIKKTIEADDYVKQHVAKILSYHNDSNDEFEDIYYARVNIGKCEDGYWENIHNEETDFALYFIVDLKSRNFYFYFIYKGNEYKVDLDFTRKVMNSYAPLIGVFNMVDKDGDAINLMNGSIEENGYFSMSIDDHFYDLIKQNNCMLVMTFELDDGFYGIYGKSTLDNLPIKNFDPMYNSTANKISDIAIEIKSAENNKEYNINSWSNHSQIYGGINSFNNVDGALSLDIPVSEFTRNGKTTVTVNVKVKNKQSEVLSEKAFSFEVKRTIVADTGSVIKVETNSAMAQYMSMSITNKPMLVRLNTLFARQLVKRANKGIDTILTLDTQRLPEPALEGNTDDTMDFNGANALYFWELFYYTPMMVANVMLEGHNYDEAGRWLRYVFSPNGYIENGTYSDRVWNSQPLLTDTDWDKVQLDSTDPDAVAQTDPMHYKLATFMKCLDILMERGDSAYRVLERDTLNEAKMWYMQALKLLGDETELLGDNVWLTPKLTEAATKTKQSTRVIKKENEEAASPRTANSLTALFLPQINEKLAQYRDTLKVRLFNLRHNLSIDGQPLSLAIYATPADPKALQNAAVNQSQGGSTLPNVVMPTQRFPVILNSAKSMVSQLMQFGSSLFSITERQDAQALSELFTTQGGEIILQNMKYQTKSIEEFIYNEKALKALRVGAQNRLDHYSKLYDENISTSEQQAMDLYLASSVLNTASQGLNIAGAAADLVPNIYGLAVGGSRLGAIFNATSIGLQLSGSATRIAADRLSQSESYRRRREEWVLSRDNAKSELEQIDAQLEALKVRKDATSLQLDSLKLQQQQTQEHLTFLQNKFTNKALYNWLRGKLMAIYKPFYDLAISRCRMAELAYQYDLGETQTFIRPGAWQGNYSGLMAGENLMHNLTHMENSYLEKDKRALEITKIVSLGDVYQGLSTKPFGFEQVTDVINQSKTQLGTAVNGITLKNGQLQASIRLSDLAIDKDYPADLGQLRRVKQISVTLPALTGAYQNIRAVLNYGGSAVKPRGCNAIAISHGMNDSGQFQLNFNDDRYLPFEGLPVNDSSTLTLSFPDATSKQKEMLLTLNDIILHINYTIR